MNLLFYFTFCVYYIKRATKDGYIRVYKICYNTSVSPYNAVGFILIYCILQLKSPAVVIQLL